MVFNVIIMVPYFVSFTYLFSKSSMCSLKLLNENIIKGKLKGNECHVSCHQGLTET